MSKIKTQAAFIPSGYVKVKEKLSLENLLTPKSPVIEWDLKFNPDSSNFTLDKDIFDCYKENEFLGWTVGVLDGKLAFCAVKEEVDNIPVTLLKAEVKSNSFSSNWLEFMLKAHKLWDDANPYYSLVKFNTDYDNVLDSFLLVLVKDEEESPKKSETLLTGTPLQEVSVIDAISSENIPVNGFIAVSKEDAKGQLELKAEGGIPKTDNLLQQFVAEQSAKFLANTHPDTYVVGIDPFKVDEETGEVTGTDSIGTNFLDATFESEFAKLDAELEQNLVTESSEEKVEQETQIPTSFF